MRPLTLATLALAVAATAAAAVSATRGPEQIHLAYGTAPSIIVVSFSTDAPVRLFRGETVTHTHTHTHDHSHARTLTGRLDMTGRMSHLCSMVCRRDNGRTR
jgi:hypothetical protein